MFQKIGKIFKHIRSLKKTDISGEKGKNPKELMSRSYSKNLSKIMQIFSNASDVVFREFEIGKKTKIKAFIVFIDGLVNQERIQMNVIEPLILADISCDHNLDPILSYIQKKVLSVSNVEEVDSFELVTEAILNGEAVLFLDGLPKGLKISVQGWEFRNISEPKTEVVVRGPREAFTENLDVNISQIRRKIKNPNLKFEKMTIGRQTKTAVIVAYIKGIANEKVLKEVKKRLSRIDTDSILESGYIEEFIEDGPLSFLPTVGNSEKPDVVAAKMLEGRVAIITDGTPFVLTVPYLFVEAFQSSEDYYSRPFYVTMIRWLRFLAYLISIFFPALYVAITTFHQEVVPSSLLITMAAAREGTPFPIFIEVLGMGVVYEILREAGIRLPRPVGQAVSIVGALVIGESAVSAGLIGAPMVIVVAITAISSFVVSSISDTTSIMRLYYVVLSGFLGFFGIMIGASVLLTHMVSLRSFGVPYLYPMAPTSIEDLKDVAIRSPWWAMFKRPDKIQDTNLVRQRPNLMPGPYDNDNNR